jgi:hypothetical protein
MEALFSIGAPAVDEQRQDLAGADVIKVVPDAWTALGNIRIRSNAPLDWFASAVDPTGSFVAYTDGKEVGVDALCPMDSDASQSILRWKPVFAGVQEDIFQPGSWSMEDLNAAAAELLREKEMKKKEEVRGGEDIEKEVRTSANPPGSSSKQQMPTNHHRIFEVSWLSPSLLAVHASSGLSALQLELEDGYVDQCISIDETLPESAKWTSLHPVMDVKGASVPSASLLVHRHGSLAWWELPRGETQWTIRSIISLAILGLSHKTWHLLPLWSDGRRMLCCLWRPQQLVHVWCDSNKDKWEAREILGGTRMLAAVHRLAPLRLLCVDRESNSEVLETGTAQTVTLQWKLPSSSSSSSSRPLPIPQSMHDIVYPPAIMTLLLSSSLCPAGNGDGKDHFWLLSHLYPVLVHSNRSSDLYQLAMLTERNKEEDTTVAERSGSIRGLWQSPGKGKGKGKEAAGYWVLWVGPRNSLASVATMQTLPAMLCHLPAHSLGQSGSESSPAQEGVSDTMNTATPSLTDIYQVCQDNQRLLVHLVERLARVENALGLE